VVADEPGRGPAASVTRVRLRWLAIVVAIMALLTAGWPLLNSAVANRQPLPAGAKVTVGSGRASSGTVTVGPGWYVQPEQSNSALESVLSNGGIVIDIRHVAFVNSRQLRFMWRGMRQILSVTHPGYGLSQLVRTTTVHGMQAFTCAVSGPRLAGMVTIVPGPSREFAIAMVVLAPHRASPALRAAARRVVLSLMFAVSSP
jgi:hypothetical protein